MKDILKTVGSTVRSVGYTIVLVLTLIVRPLLVDPVRGLIFHIVRIKGAIELMDPWYGYEPDSKFYIRFLGAYTSMCKYIAYTECDAIDDYMQKHGLKDALEEEYECED